MPTFRLASLLLAVALAACHATRGGGTREVPELLRRGRFASALRIAEENHRRRPKDPRAREEYRLASAAVLLERGRRALFEDRDEEALALFLEAQAIAPEQEAIGDWVYNAREKLALRWYRTGLASQAAANLAQARADFEQSLAYQPGFQRSEAALARTLLQINYRAGLGRTYYEDGVRDLHDHLLDEADFAFSASLKYEPGSELASERREVTREQLAEERAALALRLEGQGIYAAARNEFRMALLLDPGNAEAVAGMERMAREERAAELLSDAEWRILRKEYDRARALLAEGRGLTREQTEGFDQMERRLEEALLGDLYDRARLFESDQQYEAAIAAYSDLLDRAPYFRDAIARKQTLEENLADAAELYEQALAATEPGEQAKLLRRIAVFWPDYRDVAERLEALEPGAPR